MFYGMETNTLEYKIEEQDLGMTLIEVLSQRMEVSSRMIRKAKPEKAILLNGNAVSVNAKVRINDCIKLILEEEPNIFEPQALPLEIVFENQDLLIVNKQPYIVVHPTKGHPDGTIGNAIAYYFSQKNFNGKIRFINRLDRDTSGLLMIAKNGYAQQIVSNQMRDDLVEKKYMALVEGCIKESVGVIDLPIGRLSETDIQRAVMSDGQPSVTHFEVVKRFKEATLVKIRLETGRTHQIRVHFSHLGHPLIGDELYGAKHTEITRQALHSYYLKLKLPRTGEWVELEAGLPNDFNELISHFESMEDEYV